MHAEPALLQRLLPRQQALPRDVLQQPSRRRLREIGAAGQEFIGPFGNPLRNQKRSGCQEAPLLGVRPAGRAGVSDCAAGTAEFGAEQIAEPEVQGTDSGSVEADPAGNRRSEAN